MSTRPDTQLHKLIRIKKLNKTCKGKHTTQEAYLSNKQHIKNQIKNSKNIIYY